MDTKTDEQKAWEELRHALVLYWTWADAVASHRVTLISLGVPTDWLDAFEAHVLESLEE